MGSDLPIKPSNALLTSYPLQRIEGASIHWGRATLCAAHADAHVLRL